MKIYQKPEVKNLGLLRNVTKFSDCVMANKFQKFVACHRS